MLANTTAERANFTSKDQPIPVEEDTALTVIKSLVCLATITATLVGNSFIYAAMRRFRSLRTPTNIVLCSLASTDFAMVVVMVFHAATDLSGHWTSGLIWCDFVATLGLVVAFISILHLCFLSIDRYIAITCPLRYPLFVTKKRVLISLIFIWIVPSVFLNLPAANYRFRSEVYGCSSPHHTTSTLKLSPYIFILVTVFVAIPFGIMLYTHAVVFRIALSHVKRLSTVERRLERSAETTTTTENLERQRKPQQTAHVKREIKSAKTFALVIGVFLFCYTPFFITGTYRRVAGPQVVPHLVTFITTWLAFANSFSNPLVYSLRYSPFKKAFKKLCCNQADNRGQRETSLTFFKSSKTTASRTQREGRINYSNEDGKYNEEKGNETGGEVDRRDPVSIASAIRIEISPPS